MTNTYNIQNFLKMYYPDSNMPTYLFENENLVFCLPKQTPLTMPPKKYLDCLFSSTKRISYYATDYGVYYGCLHLDFPNIFMASPLSSPDAAGQGTFLVFGPFCDIPFSDAELHQMYADYVIPSEEHTIFRDFLGVIPQISLTTLVRKLLFLNYCLHGEMLSEHDFLPREMINPPTPFRIEETNYQKKESLLHNRSYEIEAITMNLIRTGNPEGFRELKMNNDQFHYGNTFSSQ